MIPPHKPLLLMLHGLGVVSATAILPTHPQTRGSGCPATSPWTISALELNTTTQLIPSPWGTTGMFSRKLEFHAKSRNGLKYECKGLIDRGGSGITPPESYWCSWTSSCQRVDQERRMGGELAFKFVAGYAARVGGKEPATLALRFRHDEENCQGDATNQEEISSLETLVDCEPATCFGIICGDTICAGLQPNSLTSATDGSLGGCVYDPS